MFVLAGELLQQAKKAFRGSVVQCVEGCVILARAVDKSAALFAGFCSIDKKASTLDGETRWRFARPGQLVKVSAGNDGFSWPGNWLLLLGIKRCALIC